MRNKARVHYGVEQCNLEYYRLLIKLGKSHDYCMAQMALTYKVRKVMYGVQTEATTEV